MSSTNTFSAKDLAQECGTDPKTVRKFLRSHLALDEQPGQGGRYNFTKSEVNALVKAYKKWAQPKAEKAPKEKKSKKATNDEAIEIDEEVEDFDAEPEDEELDELEAELDVEG